MAAQANMFDELSSKINKRQPQQSSLGTHNGSSSPGQIRASAEPPSQPSLKPQVAKKPQPIERVASVPASKANIPQIKVHSAKDEDSSLGQDHVDASHGGKKGGFMKSLKKMFKRKKKGKFDTDQSQLAGQYKARSEPDLLSTRESKHEKVEQVLRLNTTDTALADVSLPAEGSPISGQLDSTRPADAAVSADEEVGDPSKHEVQNDVPQKLPTSLGKFSVTMKQQNSERGEAPAAMEGPPQNQHESKTDRKVSPLPRTAKPIVPKRPSDVGTSTYVMEYSDDFFTSSLIKTEVQSVSASESLSFEAVAAVHSSTDEQNVMAKDRIRVAPKDRRKPAKFQQRPIQGANFIDGQESLPPQSTHDEVDKSVPRLFSEITEQTAGQRCGAEETMEKTLPLSEDKVLLAHSEESRSQTSSQVAIDGHLGEPSRHPSEGKASLESSGTKQHQGTVEAVPSSDPVIREGSSRGSTVSNGSSSSSADSVHRTSFDSIPVSSDSTSSLGSRVMSIFESRRPLSLSLGVLPKMNDRLGVSYVDGLKKTKSVGTLDFSECIKFVVAGKPDKPDLFDRKGGLRRSTSDIEQPLLGNRAGSHLEAAFKRRSLDDIPGLLFSDVDPTVNSVTVEHKNAREITINDESVEIKSVNHIEQGFEDAVSQVVSDSVSAIVKEDLTAINSGSTIAPVITVGASCGSPISAISEMVADHTPGVAHDDKLDERSDEVAVAFARDGGVKENAIANSEFGTLDFAPRAEDPSSDSYDITLGLASLPKHGNENQAILQLSQGSLTSITATNETPHINESAPMVDSSVAIEELKKKIIGPSANSEVVGSSRYRSLSEVNPRPYVPPKPVRSIASKDSESGTALRSSSFEEELQLPVTRSFSLSSSGAALPSPLRKPSTRSGLGAGRLTSASKEGAIPDSDWLLLARSKQSSFDDNVENETNVKPSSMKRRASSGAAKVDSGASEKCIVCGKMAYIFERFEVENKILHKTCSNCTMCSRPLLVGAMHIVEGVVYCVQHKP